MLFDICACYPELTKIILNYCDPFSVLLGFKATCKLFYCSVNRNASIRQILSNIKDHQIWCSAVRELNLHHKRLTVSLLVENTCNPYLTQLKEAGIRIHESIGPSKPMRCYLHLLRRVCGDYAYFKEEHYLDAIVHMYFEFDDIYSNILINAVIRNDVYYIKKYSAYLGELPPHRKLEQLFKILEDTLDDTMPINIEIFELLYNLMYVCTLHHPFTAIECSKLLGSVLVSKNDERIGWLFNKFKFNEVSIDYACVKSRIELLWDKEKDAHSNYAITPLTFSNDQLIIVIENEGKKVKRIHTI